MPPAVESDGAFRWKKAACKPGGHGGRVAQYERQHLADDGPDHRGQRCAKNEGRRRTDVEALAVKRSGIQLIVLLRIWRVRFLDAGEVQQHGRYRRRRLRSEDRRSKPKTLGSSAAAEGNRLALEFVVFAGKKRPLQQLDLLVGEQTHGRPPDRQPVFL